MKQTLKNKKKLEKPPQPCGQVEPFVMPKVIDICCGSRMMWFNKNDSRTIYCDKRNESKS